MYAVWNFIQQNWLEWLFAIVTFILGCLYRDVKKRLRDEQQKSTAIAEGVKSLLRESGRGLLPEEVLFRRKSPYPKTYDPQYEGILKGMVQEMLLGGGSPVMQFLDKGKVERFLAKTSDYGKPWYGQLMAGPQMLAYLLQVDAWMRQYRITVVDL